MPKVLIPIPSIDFDPSEVSISWKILNDNGIEIIFSTPDGLIGKADPIMLTGSSLWIWKSVLMAREDAISDHEEMIHSKAFLNPIPYNAIQSNEFDGLLLPGGHAKGMRPYLESKILQEIIVEFFESNKPVGAICHGVLLAARSINPKTGKSVLYQYKTTSLLNKQEMLAYQMTRLWLNDYYLTYDITVEDEVKSFLENQDQFYLGSNPLFRDSEKNLTHGFVLQDRNYISARWPGDAHKFGFTFLSLLKAIPKNI
jgi:protease I